VSERCASDSGRTEVYRECLSKLPSEVQVKYCVETGVRARSRRNGYPGLSVKMLSLSVNQKKSGAHPVSFPNTLYFFCQGQMP
jgi:hypothetical protein